MDALGRASRHRRVSDPSPHPLRRGYLAALGVLGAIATVAALGYLHGILFSVFVAAFIAIGLDPVVRRLERRRLSRTWATVIMALLIVAILVVLAWVVVPLVISQIAAVVTNLPAEYRALEQQGWFATANTVSNGVVGAVLHWFVGLVTSPKTLVFLGGGLVGFGFDLAGAIASGLFIGILSIYFVGSYRTVKATAYRLIAAGHRERVSGLSDRILENVGRYLSGMVLIALINATYSFIFLVIAGVPSPFVVALFAFLITLVPLIGTIISTTFMTLIALIHSPTSALIMLIAMLIYMQIEAYIVTPRVMAKAVKVPGSIVLISALAGGSLFGIIGSLVAIPIATGAMLIVTDVVIPAQDRRQEGFTWRG